MSCLFVNTKSAIVIAEQRAGQPSSSYAKLARMVLDAAQQGDPLASEIVKDGARYISMMARRLLALEPPRLSMIGGLAEPLQPWLDADIAARVAPPKQPPELGAVYFAQQSLAQE
ncbi:hypothetical protein [Pseudoalteromonas qingdaonensis]|uniref:hypothetical protein n=1 Tax=Pseudoalteromonas qingdaonensis TaxID=3131913 RepID=UPI003CCB92E4